jgi:hypothetical protein
MIYDLIIDFDYRCWMFFISHPIIHHLVQQWLNNDAQCNYILNNSSHGTHHPQFPSKFPTHTTHHHHHHDQGHRHRAQGQARQVWRRRRRRARWWTRDD